MRLKWKKGQLERKSLENRPTPQDLYNRSMKVHFKALKCFSDGSPSINTGLHIFDQTIKPLAIYMYASEIWGEESNIYSNGLFFPALLFCHIRTVNF